MEEQIDINETVEIEEERDDDTAESTSRMYGLRERPRKELSRKLRERSDELSFLSDFDPGNSEREKRKTKSKGGGSKSAPYDEYGHLRYNGLDVCDCMNDECPGCFFACEKCGSNKCGKRCRVNRKFLYTSITFDGKDVTIRNPHAYRK